ncbi:MAG: FGGY family carbohydrate kinase [Oscillospiraceae bacterium]
MLYVGIDLGASAVKLLLMNEAGQILNVCSKAHIPWNFPNRAGAEKQRPGGLAAGACGGGFPSLLEGFDRSQVAGIGVGGQMHGLVVLDDEDRVIRPAILWNDGRTAEQVAYLNETVGTDRLSAWTANIAFAGFTAPKLLWMREQEPEALRPDRGGAARDYINYLLTGVMPR